MARLKLATYNINGIRARLGALLEWLDREQPDIVCLQELKAPDEAFPAGDLEARGYGAIWHGQKSWNGVALLARGAQPVERRRGLPRDPAPEQSRYLEAEIHGLVVGAIYLPNGNPWPGPKFDYKLAWFERLLAHARALLEDGGPVVLAGDYNVVPTDEFDIYDPKSWRKDALLQPESREAWFRLLGQGWTDAIRAVHGDAKIFTFWDYFRRHWERDAGLRIDHLLLSPVLAPMLRDAGVDRWVRGRPGASDHAPTWVVLDTERGAAGPVTASPAAVRAGGAAVAKARGGATRGAKPATPAGTSRRSTAKKPAPTRAAGTGIAKKVRKSDRGPGTGVAGAGPATARAAGAKKTSHVGSGAASGATGARGATTEPDRSRTTKTVATRAAKKPSTRKTSADKPRQR